MGKVHYMYDDGRWQPEEPHMVIACGLDWDRIKDWSPTGVDTTTDTSKVTCKNCLKTWECIYGYDWSKVRREHEGTK
jgi:hypothetical protein